jgi:flagellar biosynthesis GTPase FlhF
MQRRTSRTILAVAVVAASIGIIQAQGGLTGLGVDEATARQRVGDWVESGYLNLYPAARAFKTAAPSVRATAVTTAFAWARAYTETAAFKAVYEKQRQADKPAPPKFKGTVDDELAAKRAERRKSLEESKKNLAQLPAEMRPQMEATIKQMEAQFAKMDGDPQMVAMTRQGIEMERANEQKMYEQRVAAHEKRFPADPKVAIARRLQDFLTTSQDVDFSAKLVPAGSRMKFADPRYEDQRAEWKVCYRAGKEATAAARQAAQAWLAALK